MYTHPEIARLLAQAKIGEAHARPSSGPVRRAAWRSVLLGRARPSSVRPRGEISPANVPRAVASREIDTTSRG